MKTTTGKRKRKGIQNPVVLSLTAVLLATLHNLFASLSTLTLLKSTSTSHRRRLWRHYFDNSTITINNKVDVTSLDRHFSVKDYYVKQQEASLDDRDDHLLDNHEDDNRQHDSFHRQRHPGATINDPIILATNNNNNKSIVMRNQKQWQKLNKRLTQERLKDFFLERPHPNFTFSNQTTRIYLIHPGKTAGSYLYQKLGIEIARKRDYINCHMQQDEKDFDACLGAGPLGRGSTQLWRLTVGHRHLAGSRYTKPQQRYLRNNGTNLLLWTVRDPVARVVSAYNFHHYTTAMLVSLGNTTNKRKNGKKFFDCFDSIQTLAEATATHESWVKNLTSTCRRLGYGFLKGIDREPGRHLFANYQYYVAEAWRPGKAIAVVRTEHLEHDVRDLERRLGGDPAILGDFERDVKSRNFTRHTGLTPQGKRWICCAIVNDMPFFEKLVMLSLNLKDKEKVAYLLKSRRECAIPMVDVNGNNHGRDIANFSWKQWHERSCPNITPKG